MPRDLIQHEHKGLFQRGICRTAGIIARQPRIQADASPATIVNCTHLYRSHTPKGLAKDAKPVQIQFTNQGTLPFSCLNPLQLIDQKPCIFSPDAQMFGVNRLGW